MPVIFLLFSNIQFLFLQSHLHTPVCYSFFLPTLRRFPFSTVPLEVGFKTSVSVVEGATFTSLRKAGEYEVFLTNDMTVGGDLAKYIAQNITGDSHKHGLQDAQLMELAEGILTTIDAEPAPSC